MADPQQDVRSINWQEAFAFSHIFKSFRMAIHPGKMVLALAMVATVFAAGWVMDRIWTSVGIYAVTGEVRMHFLAPPETFSALKNRLERRGKDAAEEAAKAFNQRNSLDSYTDALRSEIRDSDKSYFFDAFKELLQKENSREDAPLPKSGKEFEKDPWSRSLSAAAEQFDGEIDRVEKLVDQSRKQARDVAGKDDTRLLTPEDKEKALDKIDKDHAAAMRAMSERKEQFQYELRVVRGRPVFDSLCEYVTACMSSAISAVCRGDVTSSLDDYQNIMRAKANPQGSPQSLPGDHPGGAIFWTLAARRGVKWFVCEHWLYAVIFLVVCLAAWALFGGAIHRIAALHAAREEKTPVVQALRFSASKFLSFFFAPLMPVAGIVVLGALIIAGSLLGNIPGVGAIVVGGLFFLAIVLGLVMAFLGVGLGAGGGLMYPTIAVEGSDSFDAMSRSFSYVYARPWRAVLYGAVALVHGAILYLFVRLFAFIALAASHYFVKVGIWAGGERLSESADRLDVMWKAPTFSVFSAPWTRGAMTSTEMIGAFLLTVWVYVVIGLVLAFVLSYFASATTMIYYLLRRNVDATDLDDVYVEESEDDQPAEPAPAAAPVPASPAPPK